MFGKYENTEGLGFVNQPETGDGYGPTKWLPISSIGGDIENKFPGVILFSQSRFRPVAARSHSRSVSRLEIYLTIVSITPRAINVTTERGENQTKNRGERKKEGTRRERVHVRAHGRGYVPSRRRCPVVRVSTNYFRAISIRGARAIAEIDFALDGGIVQFRSGDHRRARRGGGRWTPREGRRDLARTEPVICFS